MWLAASGSLIGLVLALSGARLLKTFLYGVSATDLIAFTFIRFLRQPAKRSYAILIRNPKTVPNRHRQKP